ncbi:BRCA2 domain-containing protein/BRCA-2_OB1 domain-containing protein/BRCA-2_helical domain-containing protein [Cephalotus follicularis]|uniref:BRCA2 domain-containing protein/BRCA-2_OB1 domain-containing protein/BRCA-2_helical domain-containing protein n=1 Tax=Cephalotus follicularis TaxID=3775 RepID=A0A1Q3C9G3_CEPFO|nr:BRCA2 domain-containing protein/BRCA-2_OB1 domain-containing protein/BRCA-2_helical domain-containing protein [Cephalotus follicularis]
MSTWQISSDAGNNFRWENSGRIIKSKPANESNGARIQQAHNNSSPSLPSMADLLFQGCSKLLENRDEGDGNSVILNRSSTVSGSVCCAAEAHVRDNGCKISNSLFQTGSGNKVNISSAGLIRAKTLLGLAVDNDSLNFQGLQHTKKQSTIEEQSGSQNPSHLELNEGFTSNGILDATPIARSLLVCKTGSKGSKWHYEVNSNKLQSEIHDSVPKPPQIKFQTAGGKSLSVSSDALQRARSLLGDPELGTFFDEADVDDPALCFFRESSFNDILSSKENESYTPFYHQGTIKSKKVPKIFMSPLKSSSKQARLSLHSEDRISGSNLIQKFDAVDSKNICGLNDNIFSIRNPLNNMALEFDSAIDNSSANGIGTKTHSVGRSFGGPLVDISNRIDTTYTNNGQLTCLKRRFGISFVSPFKRPRNSKFTTPLNKNVSRVPNGLSTLSSENSCSRTISTKYPFQFPRKYVKEYFGEPPSAKSMLEPISDQLRCIKSDNADNYVFRDESGLSCIGMDAFFHILAQSGASVQYASREWVTNHYKWIVWKLACYERCYPDKSAGKFLTVCNVLEELKYRYEREVNHGHRSAIKRILEGDASPSSMLVLCISAICLNCEPKIETRPTAVHLGGNSDNAKVELTDGWYSVDAVLDVLLTKQLAAGKLFVGQKLRIWGAALCGWIGPVSPLEASKTVSLILNINGTYRAHWADRLGFCKGVRAPLAFWCIKSNGGPVPQTLVGVKRIYPVLYKEKLSNGESIVRSEKMETRRLQLYDQRRSNVVEGIMSDYHRGIRGSHMHNDSDSEEGAKILKVLETAAEPEVLMAEMSLEQLNSFATYKAKLEVARETHMEKSIQEALQEAGLSNREVTPFMRVRVVGLTSKSCQKKGGRKEGLITIWNPTEKQRSELVEGQAYAIAGLLPVNSDSEALYLQARGSTTKWHLLSPLAIKHFMPFFSPRKSILLSNLGEVPLSSEFDIAAFVVHAGEVHTTGYQKKQWVFVTDGSISKFQSGELPNSLLAICFCSPYVDDDSFAPINYNLVGSTVGFCNLIKRAKDQMNQMWVAEATENSTYFLSFDTQHCSHLKSAAQSAQSWARISSSIIGELKEKVFFIIGDCKG